MEKTRQLMELESLNRAFQKAFSQSESREGPENLIRHLGTELECDRISIFEQGADGTYDLACEWYADGRQHSREWMHALPEAFFSGMLTQLREQEYLKWCDMDAFSAENPGIGEMLAGQGTKRMLASRLAFHGQELGFFLMENPGMGMMENAAMLIPGIRYILSSLIYNEHLMRRLRNIDHTDRLTGMGNLSGLRNRIGSVQAGHPVGLCYVETTGWSRPVDAPDDMRTDLALIRTGEILAGLFGKDHAFRVAPGEFLTISAEFPIPFDTTVEKLQAIIRDSGLSCGIGHVFLEAAPENLDEVIRRIHLEAHQDAENREPGMRTLRTGGATEISARKTGMTTGADISLYRTDEFFRMAEEWLEKNPGQTVITIVFDLNFFKLYNDIFGREAGNRFLESMASDLLKQARKLDGLAGYLGGDNFVLFFPWQKAESPRNAVEEIYRNLSYPDGFSPVMGVCLSRDPEPLPTMYDHALTALQEIKGSYMDHCRFYNPEHYMRVRDDKLLLMEIREGLERNEFVFYLQPQVKEQNGKIVGAEALCRWKHKGKLINPSQFIPSLEKSGMIFEVDRMIWEQVAAWLRSCADRGLPQIPVSVNVSRMDFFFTDIAEYFIALAGKYGIAPELLGVEITESAFADNMEMIMGGVERLHDAGFHVLMDDFGSGYSSLSMLHTMNLDVLKTDVKFMSQKDSDSKAISIVESVVSMAHMIGMVVITEGIETENQRENMIAIGENYAQGFLFYRPMPPEQFETLLTDPECLDIPYIHADLAMKNQLHFREMVHSGVLSGSLLDNLIGPAAVLLRREGQLSVMQMNDACRELLGQTEQEREAFLNANRTELVSTLDQAVQNPGRGIRSAFRMPERAALPGRVFLLYRCDDHTLYFAAFAADET